MPKSNQYPNGKRTVRFLVAVGKQAEINPALPHILVPKIGTIVEVSAELAWALTEKGRIEIVEDTPEDAQAPEASEPQIEVEGEGPAQGDSEGGPGLLRGLFGNRGASNREDASEGESTENPEPAEGEATDVAAEADADAEGPNDPLS